MVVQVQIFGLQKVLVDITTAEIQKQINQQFGASQTIKARNGRNAYLSQDLPEVDMLLGLITKSFLLLKLVSQKP